MHLRQRRLISTRHYLAWLLVVVLVVDCWELRLSLMCLLLWHRIRNGMRSRVTHSSRLVLNRSLLHIFHSVLERILENSLVEIIVL